MDMGLAPLRQAAFLFDMDGTILTSIPAVERCWSAWAIHAGADVAAVLDYMHGRPAADTIARFLPAGARLDEEVAYLDALELADLDGIAAIGGAAALLSRLPATRWAVVTSANRALALKRIAAAGLPLPGLLVSSDDVSRGKPDPEGYRKAALALGYRPEDCLVFEDTETGLAAGRAAGCRTIRIGTGPAAIDSYERLCVTCDARGLTVTRRTG